MVDKVPKNPGGGRDSRGQVRRIQLLRYRGVWPSWLISRTSETG